MAETEPFAATIRDLAAGLTPVRRLAPPTWRALAWTIAVAALTVAVYLWLGAAANAAGFFSRPWVIPSLAGAVLTALLAALAAFQLSLPDRAPAWALLPLPALALWVVSSGLGCLAGLGGTGNWGISLGETRECLSVILGVSVPVSLLLVVMLRRAFPLRPNMVAMMAGLAAAAAAGSVLLVVHPHNSSVLDLGIHALCVLAVIGANAVLGGRLLARL